ncbi:MAG: toxin-antitoxin system TumE family protein [Anaerolineae bacterium]
MRPSPAPYPQPLKYRYHLQKADGTQIVHWDNVAHHAHLSTFPHHKHNQTDAAYPSEEMNLEKAFMEIAVYLYQK